MKYYEEKEKNKLLLYIARNSLTIINYVFSISFAILMFLFFTISRDGLTFKYYTWFFLLVTGIYIGYYIAYYSIKYLRK